MNSFFNMVENLTKEQKEITLETTQNILELAKQYITQTLRHGLAKCSDLVDFSRLLTDIAVSFEEDLKLIRDAFHIEIEPLRDVYATLFHTIINQSLVASGETKDDLVLEQPLFAISQTIHEELANLYSIYLETMDSGLSGLSSEHAILLPLIGVQQAKKEGSRFTFTIKDTPFVPTEVMLSLTQGILKENKPFGVLIALSTELKDPKQLTDILVHPRLEEVHIHQSPDLESSAISLITRILPKSHFKALTYHAPRQTADFQQFAKYLAKNLRNNPKLEEITLEDISIGGVENALIEALKVTPTLSINIKHQGWENAKRQEILNLSEGNRRTRERVAIDWKTFDMSSGFYNILQVLIQQQKNLGITATQQQDQFLSFTRHYITQKIIDRLRISKRMKRFAVELSDALGSFEKELMQFQDQVLPIDLELLRNVYVNTVFAFLDLVFQTEAKADVPGIGPHIISDLHNLAPYYKSKFMGVTAVKPHDIDIRNYFDLIIAAYFIKNGSFPKTAWTLERAEILRDVTTISFGLNALKDNPLISDLTIQRLTFENENQARTLLGNPHLRKLAVYDLKQEAQMELVCQAIAQILPGSNIESLDFSKTRFAKFTNQNINQLSESLKNSLKMRELNFSKSSLSDRGADLIIEVLQANRNIESVNLEKTEISPDKKQEIEDLLQENWAYRRRVADAALREFIPVGVTDLVQEYQFFKPSGQEDSDTPENKHEPKKQP